MSRPSQGVNVAVGIFSIVGLFSMACFYGRARVVDDPKPWFLAYAVKDGTADRLLKTRQHLLESV